MLSLVFEVFTQMWISLLISTIVHIIGLSGRRFLQKFYIFQHLSRSLAMPEVFIKKLKLSGVSQLQSCWVRLWCKNYSPSIGIESNLIIKTNHALLQFLAISGNFWQLELAFRGQKRKKWHSRKFLQVIRKPASTLVKEMQPLVHEKGRFFSDYFHMLAVQIHKTCETGFFEEHYYQTMFCCSKIC